MTCDETLTQYVVERMLNACEALGGVVIFIVDMEIAMSDRISGFSGQEIVVDKWFGCFRSEFHHHSCRRICVHVGILTGNVVVFRFDDFQEYIAGFCPAGNAPLVAVCDVAFGHLFPRGFHQLYLNAVLNLLYRHLFATGHSYSVGDFLN